MTQDKDPAKDITYTAGQSNLSLLTELMLVNRTHSISVNWTEYIDDSRSVDG